MKKWLLMRNLLLLLLVCPLQAEDRGASVNIDLLAEAKREVYIEDFSYVAPKNYSSGKQIRDMGRRLGAEVKYQAEVNKSAFPFSSGQPDYKYKASRVFPGKKAGADVIYIGRLSKVCTFKNLNRVLSGYIERAYGLSMESADQIALKVCYWNTNHYNDRAYFVRNFEHRVVEVFENRTKSIGLARSYKHWHPARIVIPFVLVQEVAPEAVAPALAVTEPEPVAASPAEPETETVEEPVETEAPYQMPDAAYREPVPAPRQAAPAPTSSYREPEKGFIAENWVFLAVGGGLLLVLVVIAVVKGSRRRED